MVEGSERLFNTSILIGPDGGFRGVYRKIHMFDVDVEGVSYRESELEDPGDAIVVADADGVAVGLSICYDLRFPELFRILALRDARVITVPSAFTSAPGATTGRCCCARGRSRTRCSWSPRTRSATRRPTTAASGTR